MNQVTFFTGTQEWSTLENPLMQLTTLRDERRKKWVSLKLFDKFNVKSQLFKKILLSNE